MTVRVAVIGAGGMAEDHLANLGDNPDAEAVAVCATSEASARETAEQFDPDIAAYADPVECYDAEDPDAAIVAVPPFAHGDVELAAADRDIDLFVEKPLALSRDTAREIGEAVEAAELVTQVGHVFRYADVVERAAELVGDRQLALAEGRWIDGVAPLDWWSEKAKSGGQVVEQAVHVYDLVRYFAGEVDSLAATGDRRVVSEVDFAGASTATMHHESGAVSQVSASSASPVRDVGVELVGEHCRLELDLDDHVLSGFVDGREVHEEGRQRAYAKELDAFVEAVAAGDPSGTRSPYADALRSFELTMDVTDEIEPV